MQYSSVRLATVAAVLFSAPAVVSAAPAPPLQNLTSPYTLTAYKPSDPRLHGMKVQYIGALALGAVRTGSYCPTVVTVCPNGTDTAFAGTLYPLSMVPGGQDFYVSNDGTTHITVQHSHYFPPNSYPNYLGGWTWTGLPVTNTTPPPPGSCDSGYGSSAGIIPPNDPRCANPLYNCRPPTGFFTFREPDTSVSGPRPNATDNSNGVGGPGGVLACPPPEWWNPPPVNESSTTTEPRYLQIVAETRAANRTGCVALDGLATVPYNGPNPPVWAY